MPKQAGYKENFTLSKPQPWKVGGVDGGRVLTPSNPNPKTSRNPKRGGRISGPGPAFGDSPKA